MTQNDLTRDEALAADAVDALHSFRSQFALPAARDGLSNIYLCGHSLGLAPRSALTTLSEEFADWMQLGVAGHEVARRPWVTYAERLAPALATVVGASPQDVIAMNSLSVNLHLMLANFYQPSSARRKILIEAGAFSSDRHAVASQIAWHGLDPQQELIELAPRSGEGSLRAEDIDAAIGHLGASLALVLWPGVQFRTGQAFDTARVVRSARSVGAAAGLDHAHAIGNIPLQLAADAPDFAVWCSYKYLNAGPGAIGGCYIHSKHSDDPRLRGWWGHEGATRFRMSPDFVAAAGAAAYALSNPPIFSAAPLLASLHIFGAAGLPALRKKSIALTAMLERVLDTIGWYHLTMVTPRHPAERGCQLSVRVRGGAAACKALYAALSAQQVSCDLREPDLLRFAPVPLYNSFEDVWTFGERLRTALHSLGGP